MHSTKKIVYLGTKAIGATCLQYLLTQAKVFDFEIMAIGTKERKELDGSITVAQLAYQYDIPLITDADEIPECDILYSVQYHQILKAEHIERARIIAVNLHLAPLPDYRGCNQFSFAIANEAKVFGVTIHQIDTGIDSGGILFEDRFEMPAAIWVKDLVALTTQKGINLFKATLPKLLDGYYRITPQSELYKSRGSHLYYRKDILQLKQIDLKEDSAIIKRKIRATYMPGFEPPFAMVAGTKEYIDIENYQ